MFESINLKAELLKLRDTKTQNEIDKTFESFKNFFRADWEKEIRINQSLAKGDNEYYFPGSDLNPERVFDIRSIKTLCSKYRLRFLPTKYFKANFPMEAISAIKGFERSYNTEITNFMVIAPSSLFKLEDANKDPLLFVPLPNGKYYLIHKWGNDLAWYRRLIVWPMKSISNLVLSIILLSFLVASALPGSVLSSSPNYLNFGRLIFAVWLTLSLSALVSFLWFALNQKFSDDAWNSHTFN